MQLFMVIIAACLQLFKMLHRLSMHLFGQLVLVNIRRASPQVNAWRGYAFELVCLLHAEQVKAALGISVIASDICSWRSRRSSPAAQVDLVIDRADGTIDLCEMKWSEKEFSITKRYDAELRDKAVSFGSETATRKALHLVLVASSGMARNAYANDVQAVITADDLFA